MLRRIIYYCFLCSVVFELAAMQKRSFFDLQALDAQRVSSGDTPPRKERYKKQSPDRTPKTGTYYANITGNGAYKNMQNVIGLSRASTHAKSPEKSTCTVVGPWLTNTTTVNQLLENHNAGVKQTVIVGSQAVNNSAVKKLVDAGVDVRVNNRVHTKAIYRRYVDKDGIEHTHQLLGSANPTERGFCSNLDGLTVLGDAYTSDFESNMSYLSSRSIPYNAYKNGSRKQLSPYKPKHIQKTPEKALYNTRKHDVAAKIVDSINKLPKGGSVVASTYTLNDTSFAQSLKNAADRGVAVTLYIDKNTRVPKNMQHMIGDYIQRVPVKSGIQHDKSVICHDGNGGYTTYYGSNNRTYQAQQKDINHAIVTKSPSFAKQHMKALQQAIACKSSNNAQRKLEF